MNSSTGNGNQIWQMFSTLTFPQLFCSALHCVICGCNSLIQTTNSMFYRFCDDFLSNLKTSDESGCGGKCDREIAAIISPISYHQVTKTTSKKGPFLWVERDMIDYKRCNVCKILYLILYCIGHNHGFLFILACSQRNFSFHSWSQKLSIKPGKLQHLLETVK